VKGEENCVGELVAAVLKPVCGAFGSYSSTCVACSGILGDEVVESGTIESNGDDGAIGESGVMISCTYSLDGREKANVGGGDAILRIDPMSWHGLGNAGMLNIELVLIRFESRALFQGSLVWPSCSDSEVSIRYVASDRVGELGVKDVRTEVGFSFSSGANTEEVGGLGRDLVLEKPMPTECEDAF